jgi:hypothetical protein
MKFKIPLFIFCFLIAACSSIRPIQKTGHKPDHVELGIKDSNHEPKNVSAEDANIKIKVEETVRVGEQGGEIYSNPVTSAAPVERNEKRVRIGINFGPGLNRVINYVSVLKVLERHNLAPAVVTGTGMGAIVAAMYADGMTPEMIEWNFYKYFKEYKASKPYEKEWFKQIDQILLTKFKNSKIEDTKRKLFITLYDTNLKKAFYFDHGNIRELLLKGLQLPGGISENPDKKYGAVFEKEVFNAHLLAQMGVDFTLGVDSLGMKFDFDRPNEFLIGIYGRTSGRIQKEKSTFDHIITLPLSKMNLDSNKDLPLAMKRTYEFMGKELVIIKNKIQLKMDAQ